MSKEARKRAFEVLTEASGRPFLASAPLMAIVEVVRALDEAGLLVDPEVADLDPDAPIQYTVSASPEAREEALRSRVELACETWESGDCSADDLLHSVRKALDEVEITDAALELCAAVYDANDAGKLLASSGYQGPILKQVQKVLADVESKFPAPLPPEPVNDKQTPCARLFCSSCSQPLASNGDCLNLAGGCKNALTPF